MKAKFTLTKNADLKLGDEVSQTYWGERFYKITSLDARNIVIDVDGRGLNYDRAMFSQWQVKVQPKPRKKASTATQAYKGNGKHEWETVISNPSAVHATLRLRVPGGWLYRQQTSTSMTFVPMPEVVKHAI